MRFGYASLALIVFRIFWGLAGTRYSRFSSFRLGPKVLLQKIPELYSKKQSNSAGHSETGAWATVLLLTLVTIQAGTGLFISDDIFYAGPYNPVVSGSTAGMLAYVHHINFNILQAAVALHLAAIAWYAWRKKENLLSPMLHGNKTVKPNLAIPSSHTGRAILAAIIAVALISLLVLLAPEPSMYDFF